MSAQVAQTLAETLQQPGGATMAGGLRAAHSASDGSAAPPPGHTWHSHYNELALQLIALATGAGARPLPNRMRTLLDALSDAALWTTSSEEHVRHHCMRPVHHADISVRSEMFFDLCCHADVSVRSEMFFDLVCRPRKFHAHENTRLP